jgi:hypothetical protein
VNIRNSSKHKYRDITPVVAIEHCTWVSTALQRAPAGRLQEYSLITGGWRTVYYDTIGTGKDYLNVVEQSPLTINPGATVSFTFQVAFDPSGPAGARRPRRPDRPPGVRGATLLRVAEDPRDGTGPGARQRGLAGPARLTAPAG